MQNGMTKAQTLEMIRHIDLVGLTLTLEEVSGEPSPKEIKQSLIMLLAGVRDGLAQSYGIKIDSRESIGLAPKSKHHLTPQETADEILRDLDDDRQDLDEGDW